MVCCFYQQQINIQDALLSSQARVSSFTVSTLATAFAAIKLIPKYDHYGIAVAAVKLTFALLDEMRSFFERICGSTAEM